MSRDSFCLFHLDDLAIRHIIDYLSVGDVLRLSSCSGRFHDILHGMFTMSLPLPLDEDEVMDTSVLEKPVLELTSSGTTDRDCPVSTRSQLERVNITKLKNLCLECHNSEDEECIRRCSDYHQRILYNIYHKHWRSGTAFSLERLCVTVDGKIQRLLQAMDAMDNLGTIEVHFPFNMDFYSSLIESICEHQTIRKVSITVLCAPPQKLSSRRCYRSSTRFSSPRVDELTITDPSGVALPISRLDLPRLAVLNYLPSNIAADVLTLLSGPEVLPDRPPVTLKSLTSPPDLTGPWNRFRLLFRGCPDLRYYNNIFVGDLDRRAGCDEWVVAVARRMKQETAGSSSSSLMVVD